MLQLVLAQAAASVGKSKDLDARDAVSSSGPSLDIDFNNHADPEATVITVSGPDRTDLLSHITGAFNSLDLVVTSANIATTEDGRVLDIFRVIDGPDGKKASLWAPSCSKSFKHSIPPAA